MILPMEQQVVSVDLAKEMEEEGFPQDSYWYWANEGNRWGLIDWCEKVNDGKMNMPSFYENFVSAYTVAEMGEILPAEGMKIHREKEDTWDVSYNTNAGNNLDLVWEQSEKLADAMAKMALYLKKEGLL